MDSNDDRRHIVSTHALPTELVKNSYLFLAFLLNQSGVISYFRRFLVLLLKQITLNVNFKTVVSA